MYISITQKIFIVSAAEKKTRETSQKPVFMGKLMNTALITDSSASMMVHVKGNPNPEVKFMKDGADLKEDARVVVNRDGGPNGTYEIIVKKVQTGDAGSYTCVASNSFGSEECVGTVTVKGWVILFVLFFPRHCYSQFPRSYLCGYLYTLTNVGYKRHGLYT